MPDAFLALEVIIKFVAQQVIRSGSGCTEEGCKEMDHSLAGAQQTYLHTLMQRLQQCAARSNVGSETELQPTVTWC